MTVKAWVITTGLLTALVGNWVGYIALFQDAQSDLVTPLVVKPLKTAASPAEGEPVQQEPLPRIPPPPLPALPLLSAKLLGTVLGDDPPTSQAASGGPTVSGGRLAAGRWGDNAQADLAKAFVLDTLDGSHPSVLTIVVGDPLQGRRLTQIERGLIRLRQPNGMEEELRLAESPTDGAIHEVGPDVYQVDRRLMTRMLKGNANNLRTQAIIHPSIRRFQLTGFRLARVEPESLVEQAGFERNDVITAVGERKLTSVSAALTAYQEARESQEVAIEVTRGGRSRTLRYYLN